MSSIMEDDYAPATRHPWIATLAPLLFLVLIAVGVWWWRSGE